VSVIIKPTELLTLTNPTPTPSPTPKPLTFAQMNALYGPCTNTPVFMYHHVQSKTDAIKNNQVALSTNTDTFDAQLGYLKEKGYDTIDIETLINFFKGNAVIPAKSVILTFDDGYENFYTNAYPILRKYNYKAIAFIPTGLVNNSGYLSWDEIKNISSEGLVYFANHTWSHYGGANDETKTTKEITTADTQLTEEGLNIFKVFAYPYGSPNKYAKDKLSSLNYNLAFTTISGKTLCAKRNYDLPRLRTGNLMPYYYGL